MLSRYLLDLALLTAPVAASLSAVDTFYPSGLSDVSWITNASLGSYGGIYEAPADEPSPPPSPYGVYDYCTMPHPRVEEYKLPAVVENGSVEARLVYLEYLQRHQRRTPYNILPGGELKEFRCDNILPYLYAGPASGQVPLQIYAKTYTDSSNPFAMESVQGTCQYPQLTVGGLLDGYQHGRDIRALYGDKLGLLPSYPDERKVWFRSSSSPLTQDSAGGVLRGIWPFHYGAIPLHQQAASVDTVNGGYSCPAQSTVLSAIESSDKWKEHMSATQPLRDTLATMFDANTNNWMSTFDHFADNFQARLCNGYELPCSRSDRSQCVTQAQADEVFRAGDWEWNYYWRENENATLYIQLVEGLFIKEILGRIEAVANGKSDLVYSHNFVHDGDIGPVLGALGIEQLRWPAMASNIAFEIWETSNAQFYARVLYSGHLIRTVHGTLDWIPVSSLVDILTPFVPTDIVSLCKA
ncbi:hypothetical protein MPDQ_000347 [Monascus purpureus]|uniref:Acid phosphatase pho5 n=1 Tax=Monascus purpureus TaxID=5098 RepID=A0A507QU53_MONPU|nr:hypothetical protein MPDQ_000347 [Monascus purpureus]